MSVNGVVGGDHMESGMLLRVVIVRSLDVIRCIIIIVIVILWYREDEMNEQVNLKENEMAYKIASEIVRCLRASKVVKKNATGYTESEINNAALDIAQQFIKHTDGKCVYKFVSSTCFGEFQGTYKMTAGFICENNVGQNITVAFGTLLSEVKESKVVESLGIGFSALQDVLDYFQDMAIDYRGKQYPLQDHASIKKIETKVVDDKRCVVISFDFKNKAYEYNFPY